MSIFQSNIPQLTANDFNEDGSINKFTNGLTIVVFYSPKCRFCETYAPEINSLSDYFNKQHLGNQIVLCNMASVQLDSTEYPYDVKGVPTTVFFYNGNPCSLYCGVRSANELLAAVNKMGTQCSLNFKCNT